MRLTRKQEAEIVAFDAKARLSERYDVRPYGSATFGIRVGDEAIQVTSKDVPLCFSKEKASRKCLRYNYIVPDRNRDPRKRDVLVCHVAVKLNRNYVPCVKVVSVADLSHYDNLHIRYRDLGYHFVAGWHVYWDAADWKNKAINAWILSGQPGAWSSAEWKFGTGLTFPWHETVNVEVLRDTRYRYCAYETGHGIGLLDWLVLYRRNPQVELLAKAKLFQLISPGGLRLLGRARSRDYVRTHVAELAKEAERLNRAEMAYCITHRVSGEKARSYFRFVNAVRSYLPRMSHYAYDSATDTEKKRFRLDYNRIRKMLGKWGVEVAEYCRYLAEAKDYGLDLRNEGTLYPPVRDGRKTFMARLEELEKENQRRHRREERARRKAQRELEAKWKAEERERFRREQEYTREERARRKALRELEAKWKAEERERFRREQEYARTVMASRLREIAGFQKSADRVLKLSGAGYSCVLAKSQDELLKEGRRMKNCVGGGTYGNDIVRGDTLILMFRDRKGKCWCDAQIDRSNWTLRQCYAKENTAAPQEVRDMASAIAAELRKQHLANRRAKRFPKLMTTRKVA